MSVLRPIAKLLLSLTRALMNPFVTLCFRIYYRKLNKSRPLPPITNELLLLPAHKLAAKLRKKEVYIDDYFRIKSQLFKNFYSFFIL